jgi:hypothetical protein
MRKTQAVLINSLSVIATLSLGASAGLAAGIPRPASSFLLPTAAPVTPRSQA